MVGIEVITWGGCDRLSIYLPRQDSLKEYAFVGEFYGTLLSSETSILEHQTVEKSQNPLNVNSWIVYPRHAPKLDGLY